VKRDILVISDVGLWRIIHGGESAVPMMVNSGSHKLRHAKRWRKRLISPKQPSKVPDRVLLEFLGFFFKLVEQFGA